MPPVSRLWEYPALGFDLLTVSGGKDICGPQASGILMGKEDLIHYALLNMSPQEDRIGRCCKVGKETIFGLLKALEIFVNQDYDATLKMYDARAQVITDAVKKFDVRPLPREFNPQALGNVTPHYSWHIDPAKLKITGPEVMQALAETKPIGLGAWAPTQAACADAIRRTCGHSACRRPWPQWPLHRLADVRFCMWQIKEGEDTIIAERLIEIFKAAPKAS